MMQLSNENQLRERRLASLLTLAVAVNILELAIPAPPFLPWLKPGLANAFTLAAIALYGIRGGITVTVLRTLLGGFIGGQPFTSIVIGGTAGLTATIAMSLLHALTYKRGILSLFGISMSGALIHSVTQIAVVNLLFVQNTILFWQFPLLGPASIITGAVTALLAYKTLDIIAKSDLSPDNVIEKGEAGFSGLSRFFAVIALSVLLFFVFSVKIQLLLSALLIILIILFRRNKGYLLLMRLIPLVLITALLN
ncbi:MAG: Gx transporter family protein, partial [Fibrobacteres bacterium]|nr:Gx transporter family protein [Fibrobacterota bacterium]